MDELTANRGSGWSSLVVTQPSTYLHLLCVQCVFVCALLRLVFVIVVNIKNIQQAGAMVKGYTCALIHYSSDIELPSDIVHEISRNMA